MHDQERIQAWILARSRALADDLSTDPYLRSARLLGYTLRSQVRGFFHDARHPVARALLDHLFTVAIESAEATEERLRAVETLWSSEDHRVLAGAWKALCRDATDAIAAAHATSPTPADVDLDDPEREELRRAAFEAWLATTDHSM